MVTAIRSLTNVHGAGLWLLFWFVCLVVYLCVCFLIKANRTKHGIKGIFIGLLIAEVIIDLVWGVIYYHGGSYTNYGMSAVLGLLMWIPVLLITGIIVTIRNKSHI